MTVDEERTKQRREAIERTRAAIRASQAVLEFLETEQRREWQAEELAQDPNKVMCWFGDIDQVCEDLAFHARRTERAVRSRFNGIELVAFPSQPLVSFGDDAQ